MGSVVAWELISAVLLGDGRVEVTASVEHADGSTRLTTTPVPLAMTEAQLDAWVEAVRGQRITPHT